MSKTATIEVKGLKEALEGIDQASEDRVLAASHAIEYFTFKIASDARDIAPKVTSALARSITPETNTRFGFAKEDQVLEGRVFTNIPYARVVEFGFSGTQQVRAHTRNITQVFGRPLGRLVPVSVSAHPRHVNRRGWYYMTEAVERNERDLVDMLRKAMKQ